MFTSVENIALVFLYAPLFIQSQMIQVSLEQQKDRFPIFSYEVESVYLRHNVKDLFCMWSIVKAECNVLFNLLIHRLSVAKS